MKGLKIFIVSLLVAVGCCSVVFAQKHRHTERTDSAEAAILGNDVKMKGNITTTFNGKSDTVNFDFDANLEEFADAMENHITRISDEIERNDGINLFGSMFGWVFTLGGILLFLIFICPLILFIFVLWLIFRPSKKEKNTTAGSPSTVTINAEPRDEALMKRTCDHKSVEENKSLMENAIMKMVIGAGLVCAAFILKLELITAIGVFMIIYGAGKFAIAKFVNKNDERSK